MNGQHWNEDELLDRLYDVGPGNRHLGECGHCRERWLQLVERRAAFHVRVEPPAEFFLRQREAIMRRIDGPSWSRLGLRLASAVAGLTVVAGGLLMLDSGKRASLMVPAPSSSAAISDSQLESEIVSLTASPVAQAARPMDALLNE